MSPRAERLLWTLFGVVAIGLAAATAHLCARSRRLAPYAASEYQVIYTGDQEDAFRLYTCDIDTLATEQLASTEAGDIFAVAEPATEESDRSPRVAFLRLGPESAQGNETTGLPGALCVMSLRGSPPTSLSGSLQRVQAVAPAWSPDATQVAFGGVEDLNGDGSFAVDEAGLYIANLQDGRSARIATALLSAWRLQWSPAGGYLLAEGRFPGSTESVAFAVEVSTGVTHTHSLLSRLTAACWSPDGKHIAAYSRADDRLHVLDEEGLEQYAIEVPVGDILELLWAPAIGDDEERFFAVCGLNSDVGAGPLFGRPASPDIGDRWTAVSGSQDYTALLSMSPDGRYLAFTRFSTEEIGDLYVFDRTAGQLRPLTSGPGFEGAATWIQTR